MNIQEAKKRLPELAGLSDESALNVIHEVYYPDMDKAELGSRLGIKPIAAPTPERSAMQVMGDAGITALKGAIGVPEAAVGVADIFTGGRVGKFLENEGGDFGFRPKEAKAILDQGYSEQQKQAFRNVADANGVADTAVAAIQNPSVIAHAVGESIPMMGMGGLIGRGVLAAAPKVGALGAGALGEGVVAAGSAAEQIRQQTADGLLTGKQAAMGGATGLTTGVFGVLGGKIAQRLGIADVDTMLAAAGTNPAVRKGVVRSMLEGAATEGLLEELPQSVSEQVLQNIALDKPLDEGVDQAIVLGTLAGATMGGGANALNSFSQPNQANVIRATEKVPESGPLSRAANAGVEARAQSVEATGVDPTQPPQEQTQQPEPVDDPVVDRIKALPAEKRSEALRAYAVLNRDGLAKGVVQYNRKLLDRLLAENDGADKAGKADPAPEPSGPLLLGYDQTPTGVMLAGPDGIRPEGRADVVNREQELGRQRDLGLTPDVLRAPRSQATQEPAPQASAPEVVAPPAPTVRDAAESAPLTSPPQMMGAFATPQDAEAYISAQRRSGGSRFQALPLPMEDGSFGVATAESPDFARAQVFHVKQERQAAGILEGDTLNKLGQPFKTKASAVLATKKIGGDAVPVKGGFVVRKAPPQVEAPQDAIDTPSAPAMAAAEPEATAPVVDSMAAPAADAQPEPVAALNQPQDADVTNTEAQPGAQAEATSDQAPAAGAVSPAAEPPDVPGAGGGALEAAGVSGGGFREFSSASYDSWRKQGMGRGTAKGWTIFHSPIDDSFRLARKVKEKNEAGGGFVRGEIVEKSFASVDEAKVWAAGQSQPKPETQPEPSKDEVLASPLEVADENDRDKFTLQRLNQETGQMEPVTFSRGEYVRYSLGGKDKFGDIDGVSQAKREFSVDGLWYPMGFAYKAERPAAAAKKTVPLSGVIARANKKYGEGLTEADRVPEQKPERSAETQQLIELRKRRSVLQALKGCLAS